MWNLYIKYLKILVNQEKKYILDERDHIFVGSKTLGEWVLWYKNQGMIELIIYTKKFTDIQSNEIVHEHAIILSTTAVAGWERYNWSLYN